AAAAARGGCRSRQALACRGGRTHRAGAWVVMSISVLITGFGPFPGAPYNPTGPLVKRLSLRRRPTLAETGRPAPVFCSSDAAVDAELARLIARHAPDVLLLFGLAARTPYLRVETQARNAVSALVPDAGRTMRRIRNIRRGATATIAGRAPFQRLVGAARTARVPVRLSRNAGSYLCNYLYWRRIEA